jgi:hypothetical protein
LSQQGKTWNERFIAEKLEDMCMTQVGETSLKDDFHYRFLPSINRDICIDFLDFDRTLTIEIFISRFVNESIIIDKYRSFVNSFLYMVPSIPESCGDEPQQEGTVPGGSQ